MIVTEIQRITRLLPCMVYTLMVNRTKADVSSLREDQMSMARTARTQNRDYATHVLEVLHVIAAGSE